MSQRLKLSSGYQMPIIGLGTFLSKPGEVKSAVKSALEIGYRHLDCAAIYGNEEEIGEAIAESNVSRDEIFVTSKLWCHAHKPNRVMPSLKKTLSDLKLKSIDLYLIHWPIALKEGDEMNPKDENDNLLFDNNADYVETWKAMEECVEQGLTKSIGLSNFNISQIERVLNVAKIKPAVLQVENHPYLQQKELVDFCRNKEIAITAYAPLGAPGRPWVEENSPVLLEDEKVKELATKYNKTPAQIVLRFQVQRDIIAIPKSVKSHRIRENFDIFDFELSQEDMDVLFSLEKGYRGFVVKKFLDSAFYPF